MTIDYNIGCNAGHIIRSAVNCKTLATLGEEENTLHPQTYNYEITDYDREVLRRLDQIAHINAQKIIHTPIRKKEKKSTFTLTTKKDLINLKKEFSDSGAVRDILGIKRYGKMPGFIGVLSHYGWPFEKYSFQEAGIDERRLLALIDEIDGDCDLTASSLKDLRKVKKIGGNLIVPYFTKLEDLSSLEEVGGKIVCETEDPQDGYEKLKSLNLKPELLEKFSSTI